MSKNNGPILVINSGSSSLKFGVFEKSHGDESLQITGTIDSIGHSGGKLKVQDGRGNTILEEDSAADTQQDAFKAAMHALEENGVQSPVAVGHRIVHGGPKLRKHQRLTPGVLETLKEAVHFAPLHDPPAIAIVEAAQKQFETVPQFVCFDTAFHSTLPETAARYPLPTKFWEQGLQRYGFHGLSYESIWYTLGHTADGPRPKRLIVAHLGSGASLAAILNGKSIDTSMGLAPTGGIPMSTRSGDLDPSILLWLLRDGLSVDEVEQILNQQSGLFALSNGESDMRALTSAADSGDAAATLAIDIFTRSIAKTIASYIVSLEGLDQLIFTGGIGEHSATIRAKVCHHLRPFAIQLDHAKNKRNSNMISTRESFSEVRVVATDEDGQIARHVRALLRTQ